MSVNVKNILCAGFAAVLAGGISAANADGWDHDHHDGWRDHGDHYAVRRDRVFHPGWVLRADGFYYPVEVYAAPPPVVVAPAPVYVAPAPEVNVVVPLHFH